MTSFLDLDDDILVCILPQFLSPHDIFNVSILNKSIYNLNYNSSLSSKLFQQLYNKIFTNNDNNFKLSYSDKLNWKQLFQLRCSSKQQVYTWGSSQFGRLGYLVDKIDQNHVTSRSLGFRGVHTPTAIPQSAGHIVTDIVASGFQFIVLSSRSQLVTTGFSDAPAISRESTPGPIGSKDYQGNLMASNSAAVPFTEVVGSRRSIRRPGVMPMPANRYDHDVIETQPARTPRDTPMNPNLTRPPDQLTFPPELGYNNEDNETSKKIVDSNFLTTITFPNYEPDAYPISISCGRQHYIVLDSHNRIASWDTGCRSNAAVLLRFPGIDPSLPILKICAGWNLSCCYIYDVGLVMWYTRNAITKEQYEAGDRNVDAHYVVIPYTKRDVVDFTVGSDFVLFIKKSDGKLYKFGMNAQELATRDRQIGVRPDETQEAIEPVPSFNNWLARTNLQNGSSAEFTRLNCCYTNFVVFTNDDDVLIGGRSHLEDSSEESESPPKIIPELQKQNIKSVEIGDYHFLALTTDGNILSWGLESSNCGCLGLGAKEEFVQNNGPSVVKDLGPNKGMEVLVPTRVKNPPIPGKWVSIAASGWHSAGVYVAE
ncbi:predicted protein [Scheffersomyces stipitis CBS 6054]|uniref:SCF-associated factor 1 n=1 Tax=Scheffersomyces stipitis (strain ATCC 58785 / CBS 6054 / NBRC 10063 / NRRL Y-11545) TaxID=322104 RepID=A3LRJ1_PICST|nr:predicted protein [Scheffersomyces stipitis CBS 6054]ABN65395.2 predicted protein [Scheffersomyces stipitis CBS 6054]